MITSGNIIQGQWNSKTVVQGAGGFHTGLAISGTTVLLRGDVCPLHIKGPSDKQWRSCFDLTTLAAGEYPNSAGYVAPVKIVNGQYQGLDDGSGCLLAAIDQSSPLTFYASLHARLYKTTNGGTTMIRVAAFPDTQLFANSQGGLNAKCGTFMILDPGNSDVFLIGTDVSGIFYSTDGGTTVNNFTPPIANAKMTGSGTACPSRVAVDPTSSVVGGVHQRWCYSIQGAAGGVFMSNAGPGGPYTQISGPTTPGSPVSPIEMLFDSTGKLWVTDDNVASNNIFTWTSGGGWSNITTSQGKKWGPLAVNHVTVRGIAAGSYIVVAETTGGIFSHSEDGGATFASVSLASNGHVNRFSTTRPWLGGGLNNNFLPGQIKFDSSGTLWAASGIGAFYCPTVPLNADTVTVPGTGPLAWNWFEFNGNLESMVSVTCKTSPGHGPKFAMEDRPIWEPTTLDASPIAGNARTGGYSIPLGFTNLPGNLNNCYDIDYAADDPNYWAAIVNVAGKVPCSGYSDDGGPWTMWPTQTISGTSTNINTGANGCLAQGNRGTTVYIYASKGRPVYTKDFGNTFNYLLLPGFPTTGDLGLGATNYQLKRIIASDKTLNPPAFYVYDYGPPQNPSLAGLYKFTDPANIPTDGTAKVFSGHVYQYDQGGVRLQCVPGQTGHLFMSFGLAAGAQTPLMHSETGGTSWGELDSRIKNIRGFGFGAIIPGFSYQAIFVAGDYTGSAYVNGAPTSFTAQRGIYMTPDKGVTWYQLAGYSNNNIDGVNDCTGDLNVPGRCYVGHPGSGWDYADNANLLAVAA